MIWYDTPFMVGTSEQCTLYNVHVCFVPYELLKFFSYKPLSGVVICWYYFS